MTSCRNYHCCWIDFRISGGIGFLGTLVTLAVVNFAVNGGLWAADDFQVSRRLNSVLEDARLTGRSVLAVAGYSSCAPCKALKSKLANDSQLAALCAQYSSVALTIDGDGRTEWLAWQDLTNTKSRSSPQLFIVRADGKVLFADSPSEDLASTLRRALNDSGRALAMDQARQAQASVAQANAIAGSGDKAIAMARLAPILKIETFAKPMVEARALSETWIQELSRDLPKPTDTLEQTEAGLRSAIALVGVGQLLGKVNPSLAKDANRQLAVRRKDEQDGKLLVVAEQIYQASFAASQSSSKGIVRFQKLIDSISSSPSVSSIEQTGLTIAKERIESLKALSTKP